MYPILYRATETNFKTQGYGTLCDCVSAKVNEEVNGPYELDLTYTKQGRNAESIAVGNLIRCRSAPDKDGQLFRIYKVTTDISKAIKVYAKHLSYDLSGWCINPFSVKGIANGLKALKSNIPSALGTCPFSFSTELTNATSTFAAEIPKSVRSMMGGSEGSLIDVFGGEWDYDNYKCKLLSVRGNGSAKSPVAIIKYGKNLTQYGRTADVSSSQYSHVIGYWKGTEQVEGDDSTTSEEVIVYGTPQEVADQDITKVGYYDCSDVYENKPTATQINTAVKTYISSNKSALKSIAVTIDTEFVQIPNSEDIELGDYVRVVSADGETFTSRIIKTVWDVLQNKYTSLTIGDKEANIVDAITLLSDENTESIADLKRAVKSARQCYTKTITGLSTAVNGSCSLGLSASKYRVLSATSSNDCLLLPGIYKNIWYVRAVNFTGTSMDLQASTSLGTVTIDYCNT